MVPFLKLYVLVEWDTEVAIWCFGFAFYFVFFGLEVHSGNSDDG